MPKTILLADDSVTIQKVVELTFMEEDCEVVTVGTGSEALQRLPELAPDLVIADVHMPGLDGYEVCRRVKAESAAIPVLLLVGTFEPFDPRDVEACGGDGFLKKPFDSQELIRTVDRLLDQAGEPVEVEAQEVADDPRLAAEMDEIEVGLPEDLEPEISELDGVALAESGESSTEGDLETDATAVEEAVGSLSDEDVDKIARRLVELVGSDAVREVVWEVVPDLAELVIKDRLRDLEQQVE